MAGDLAAFFRDPPPGARPYVRNTFVCAGYTELLVDSLASIRDGGFNEGAATAPKKIFTLFRIRNKYAAGKDERHKTVLGKAATDRGSAKLTVTRMDERRFARKTANI